jgi:hypothetical protein
MISFVEISLSKHFGLLDHVIVLTEFAVEQRWTVTPPECPPCLIPYAE